MKVLYFKENFQAVLKYREILPTAEGMTVYQPL